MKTNNVALGGLFACLHVLFLLVGKLFVGCELILVLFLPLLSTVYTLKADKKSISMFIISTLLICFIFDFVSTFIYIIPSLICGIIYGVLRKKDFKELELLCLSGLTHMVSITCSFLIIVFLFKEVNFMEIFKKVFSLAGDNLLVISLLSLFVLGFCEAFLVHVITDSELEKLSCRVEKNETVPKWFVFPILFSFSSYAILGVLDSVYRILPLVSFFVFFTPYIIGGIINFKYRLITAFSVVTFFFFSLFIIKFINPLDYLILPFFILSPFIVNNFKKTFKTSENDIK